VFVQRGTSFYEAKIMAIRHDGRINVHYDGWESSYDEDVGRERIRVA